MKKSLTLARDAGFRQPRRPAGGLQDHVAGRVDQQHSGRLPPAPPDRGAREGPVDDRVHRRRAAATLTPTQRAEVGALASSWRQEATGGIVIEMPVGSPNERGGSERVARNPLDPERGGRACSCDRDPALSGAGPGAARHDPRQLSAHGGGDRPMRTLAARHRSDLRPDLLGEQARTGIMAAPISAILPRRWPSRPISCSRAAKRLCLPRAAPPSPTSTARASPPRRNPRMPIKARSAT